MVRYFSLNVTLCLWKGLCGLTAVLIAQDLVWASWFRSQLRSLDFIQMKFEWKLAPKLHLKELRHLFFLQGCANSLNYLVTACPELSRHYPQVIVKLKSNKLCDATHLQHDFTVGRATLTSCLSSHLVIYTTVQMFWGNEVFYYYSVFCFF